MIGLLVISRGGETPGPFQSKGQKRLVQKQAHTSDNPEHRDWGLLS